MTKEAVIKDFFYKVEKRDLEGIVSLFVPNGTLNSPLYGSFPVTELNKKLFKDTKDFHVDVIDIYVSQSSPDKVIAHIIFSATLNNGDQVKTEGIDIFEFEKGSDKIKSGKFIYDSQKVKVKVSTLHG